jgi:hypothetical protein
MSWCAAENYRPGLAIENYYFYLECLMLCISYSPETKAFYVLIHSVPCPDKFYICYLLSNNCSKHKIIGGSDQEEKL